MSREGATIAGADVAPGHDGRAEVVVELRFPDGAGSRLRLEAEDAFRVLERTGVRSLDELLGRSWSWLASALSGPNQA